MTTTVQDRPEQHRFEVLVDGRVAGFADYRLSDGAITFTHTEVDDAYEGQGLGTELARTALDAARERGLSVLPRCEFIAGWMQRHPDYVELVPEERRASFGL